MKLTASVSRVRPRLPQLIAYLPQPSHVKEIALTINHGISTDMYPHRFDCFVGTYCNTTRVVFQVLLLLLLLPLS